MSFRARRKWFVILAVCASAFAYFVYVSTQRIETTGCPWSLDKVAPSGSISASDFVEFERWACYRPCPVYSIRIQADGAVHWEGRDHVIEKGNRDARINPSDAAALLERFRTQGFWGRCSRYFQEVSDSSSWVTTVSIGGRKKQVVDYAGSGPSWLAELDLEVDKLADTHRWRHGDPNVETFGLGVYVDAREPKPGTTELMVAAGRDKVDEVKRLLASGSDPNARDSSGWTALTYALQGAHKPVLYALLAAGADSSIRSFAGQTALMAAASLGSERETFVPMLLAAGGDVNTQDHNGQTALMLAADSGFYKQNEVLRYLIDHGARTDLRDVRGRTALDHLREKSPSYEDTRRLLQPDGSRPEVR